MLASTHIVPSTITRSAHYWLTCEGSLRFPDHKNRYHTTQVMCVCPTTNTKIEAAFKQCSSSHKLSCIHAYVQVYNVNAMHTHTYNTYSELCQAIIAVTQPTYSKRLLPSIDTSHWAKKGGDTPNLLHDKVVNHTSVLVSLDHE